VDRRGQAVACLEGKQRGGSLGDTARRDREREDQQRRGGLSVPSDEAAVTMNVAAENP
jgi:hypothetical protein